VWESSGEGRFSILGDLDTSGDPAWPWLCCGMFSATGADELSAAQSCVLILLQRSVNTPCMDITTDFEWCSVATSGFRALCAVCRPL
jgi:hypothetical protein